MCNPLIFAKALEEGLAQQAHLERTLRPGGIAYIEAAEVDQGAWQRLQPLPPRRYECFGCGAPVQRHEVQCSYCTRAI